MADKRPYLTLEEKEQAKALFASGKTYHAIGKELGRSPHTIKSYLTTPDAAQQVEKIKEELASMFEGLARRMIESITAADIKKINAYQRTVSAGIATDKSKSLRGEEDTDKVFSFSINFISESEQPKTIEVGRKSQKQLGNDHESDHEE